MTDGEVAPADRLKKHLLFSIHAPRVQAGQKADGPFIARSPRPLQWRRQPRLKRRGRVAQRRPDEGRRLVLLAEAISGAAC